MKKKKFFSYMLMGLLAVGATGTVTSCKDYDDDINAANKRIDDVNTALDACKSSCQSSIQSLTSQLESQNAYAQQLKQALDALTSTVNGNSSDISTLKSQLQTVSSTLATVEQTANDNKSALAALTQTVNANSTSISDLISQLKTVSEAIEANKDDITTNKANIEANKKAIDELIVRMEAAEAKGEENAKLIAEAQQALKDAVAEINKSLATSNANIAANKQAIDDLIVRMEAAEKTGKENAELIASAQKAIEDVKASLEKEIADRVADVASLTAKINTLNETVAEINQVLENKVDKDDYNATVADIYSRLQTIDTNVAANLTKINANSADIQQLKSDLNNLATTVNTVKTDLETQKQALETFKSEVESKYATIESLNNLKSEIQDKIDYLQRQIDELGISDIAGLQDALDGKVSLETYDQLKEIVNKNSESIDAINTNLNTLSYLINKSLRGLVFIPQGYYWGIESAYLHAVNYVAYQMGDDAVAKADTEEKFFDKRHESVDKKRQLDLTIEYQMNPSTADIDTLLGKNGNDYSKFAILSADKNFTRANEASLSVSSVSAANGILTLGVNVANEANVKDIASQNEVTTFATQVTIGNGQTVTSDYAAVKRENISNLKIAHTKYVENGEGWTNVAGTADVVVDQPDGNAGLLMQTANDAKTADPQDQVKWNNSGFDLKNLVELHYTAENGQKRVMSAADMATNGLSFKFELTGLYLGQNTTSESVHAALSSNLFHPQAPDYDGNQQAYGGAELQNRAQEIGRTPLVRVELVDTKGDVLDYGYIRIKLVKDDQTPYEVVSYNADTNWTDAGECEANSWSWTNTWSQTEYDLYRKVNMTREEFERNYEAEGTDADLTQFRFNTTTNEYEVATKFGTVSRHQDATSAAHTEVIEWKVSGTDMRSYYKTGNEAKKDVYIRYQLKGTQNLPADERGYVYVHFTQTGTFKIDPAHADVDIATAGIEKMWYAQNLTVQGYDEIRANTLSPDDNKATTANVLDDTFSDVFEGNLADQTSLGKLVTNIYDNTVDADGNKLNEYALDKLNFDFVFDASNADLHPHGIFRGEEKVFNLEVSADGKQLITYLPEAPTTKRVIATISGNKINEQKVSYTKDAEYAQALLNYKAYNELDNNTLRAIVALKAKNSCKELTLNTNTFGVRFLRPINVINAKAEITDAGNKEQVIKVEDLVNFTDWRGMWNGNQKAGKGGNYATYYGIESIQIYGINDGENISKSDLVTTDLNGGDKKLKDVTNQIDFTYSAANGGTLTYKNLSSNVQTFRVTVPVVVKYIWGNIYTNVTITVNKTQGSAKKF